MSEFYAVHPTAPWGDYGRILAHGLVRRASDGTWAIERCGPFVPPVTMPRSDFLVVTSALRAAALARDPTMLDFAPLPKAKIVKLDWHTWDLAAPEPPTYPPGSEPEAYISTERNDVATSIDVGDLWLVKPPSWGMGSVERTKGRRIPTFSLTRGEGIAPDIFTASGLRTVFASARGRWWLESHADPWLRFADVLVA